MKKHLVSQGWAWQRSSGSKWFYTRFCPSHFICGIKGQICFSPCENRLLESLPALQWDPTVEMWPTKQGFGEGCATCLHYRPPASLFTLWEARTLPRTQGSPSQSQSHTILTHSQINPFHGIFIQHRSTCSSGNILYSFPLHVFMFFLCLEDSFPHSWHIKILAALCIH